MTTYDKINDPPEKRRILREAGRKVAKQHQAGKRTARESGELLLDEGFVEMEPLLKHGVPILTFSRRRLPVMVS